MECKFGNRVFSKVALPDVGSPNLQPDNPERFSAFVDAIRWSISGKIVDLFDDTVSKNIFMTLYFEERNHQRILEDEFYQLSNTGVIIWE